MQSLTRNVHVLYFLKKNSRRVYNTVDFTHEQGKFDHCEKMSITNFCLTQKSRKSDFKNVVVVYNNGHKN